MILSAGYLEKANDGLVVAASVQIAREVGSSQGGSAANTELDVIGALINDSGNILSSLKQRITIPAGGNSTGNSVVVTMQFPKLASGLYQMRVAARDSKTGRLGSAMQWIEIPNITAGTFTLSSIFLTEGANGSSKSVIKPDRQFARTTKLGFQTYVYHASQSSGSPKATLQIELRHNGQVIIQTPPSLIATDGVKDLARLPVVGEFPLNAFSPGSYVLKLTVTDSLTKKSASRQIGFTVQ
jgi:hypothetical protein